MERGLYHDLRLFHGSLIPLPYIYHFGTVFIRQQNLDLINSKSVLLHSFWNPKKWWKFHHMDACWEKWMEQGDDNREETWQSLNNRMSVCVSCPWLFYVKGRLPSERLICQNCNRRAISSSAYTRIKHGLRGVITSNLVVGEWSVNKDVFV